MALGYGLLSPCGFRTKELTDRLHAEYGFTIVNIVSLIERALKQPPIQEEPQGGEDAPAGEEEKENVPTATPGEPQLTVTEQQDIMSGKVVSTNTAVRLIAFAIGIDKNVEFIKKQKEDLEKAKQALQAAQEAGTEPPEDIKLNEDGEPIVELAEPLHKPQKGFVLQGFPESAEQVEALKTQLQLDLEQVLVLKPGEEAPEPAEILKASGFGLDCPLGSVLETQLASFDGLGGVDGLKVSEVSLEASEQNQFIQIRKLIDPFYEVIDDPTAAFDIPDPDEWTPEEVDPEAEGEAAEPQERPVIPWGTCGMYCPVTLKESFWLFPGQKEFQQVYGNRVFATATEAASEAFQREPVKYVPSQREPTIPPPRILVSGPTGSGVVRQCGLLAKAYKLPVLKLEEVWKKKLEARLNVLKAAKKEAAKKELLEQPMLGDEAAPVWPEGWVPPEEKPADAEEEEEAAPPAEEPEDDGLDDEGREAQFVLAMQDALGSHCGACIIDGTWFSDLDDEEMGEDVRAARSLQNLLLKAQRFPDLSIILKCKNDIAARDVLDIDAIDKEYEAKVAAYKKLVEEAEAKEEDPPEVPEGLVIDDESEEKESDRVKAKFVEKKAVQQQALKDFADALIAARAPLQKVVSDRGDDATLKAVRWHCRPFMEQRSSLLLRYQVAKLNPSRASDMLSRGLVQPSKFHDADPLFTDLPIYPGREKAGKFSVLLRGRVAYPQNEAELSQILERPADFFHLPAPSRVLVNPAIAITGPPLSGKTALAKELAMRTGAVYIFLPEMLTEILDSTSLPFKLSQDIAVALRKGGTVPDEIMAGALRFRLASPDVLTRGWILDDFPMCLGQARALTAAGIVPHRLLALNMPESMVFARSRELNKNSSEAGSVLLQQECFLQRQRLDAYQEKSPAARAYYGVNFDNVRDIDGSRSAWAVFDQSLKETTVSITQRLRYYRRTSQGLAARIHGMCFPKSRIVASESKWKCYCPVSLTLGNELVASADSKFAVEYKSQVFWPSSEAYAKHFEEDPEAFLQVQLPSAVPIHLSLAQVKAQSETATQLENYCPVALVDRKELVKTSGHHIVSFQDCLWSFESREACMKFMRRPMRFVQRAKLPSKLPPVPGVGDRNQALLAALTKAKEKNGLDPTDMLTYMQASVAEVICQALVDNGERRPLYPGVTAQESALLYISRFLRAKNVVNTDMYAETVKEQRESFLRDCDLPSELKAMMQRKSSTDYVWTSTDSSNLKELCERFDKLFKLQ
eukprot:TRINITY_DN93972_c0_g1_i1.p1 TRINITY_DN93972_c0_g1~~TRINITY_DN93972_c0_g1_i1.p1  ORF type:complete len:1447 (+),score=386.18 TRINITY_DN93972_c0_g1_i1:577-4341(+)